MGCVGHWKLQSSGVATIGSDLVLREGGVAVDHTYDGKFNKGMFNLEPMNTPQLNIYRTVINPTTPTSFILTYWLRPHYPMINGAAQTSTWASHFSYWADDNNVIMMQHGGFGSNNTVIYFVIGGAWYYWQTADESLPSAPWNWNLYDDVFFMHCVNPSGIAGTSDTYRIYMNGILTHSSSIAGLRGPSNGYIYFGDMVGYGRVLQAVLDNPMLFDDTSQEMIDDIILNMENEDRPSSGKVFRPNPVNYIKNYPFNRPFSR